jgi:hypothetical protein
MTDAERLARINLLEQEKLKYPVGSKEREAMNREIYALESGRAPLSPLWLAVGLGVAALLLLRVKRR